MSGDMLNFSKELKYVNFVLIIVIHCLDLYANFIHWMKSICIYLWKWIF